MSTVVAPEYQRIRDEAGPEWLGWSLRERVRRVDFGELPIDRWRADATRHAAAADEVYQACVELRPVPPLGGPVRVGVKDTVDVAGFATRLGLPAYRRYPSRSAAVLRGVPPAAVVAKLVTAQLGLGLEHPCGNPRFPDLNPSGSSTGSAVAVAANICDLAVGTDSTGSIRLPANACGVTGLRLTHDRRLLEGVLPLSPLLDAPGWLTRTPDDLACAWNRFALGPAVPAPGRRYRIGVPAGLRADGCLREIVDVLDQVAQGLREAGHTTIEVDLGDLLPWRPAVWELVALEAAERQRELAESLGDQVSGSVRASYSFGASIEPRRHAEILAALGSCRADAADRFARDQVDCWLLPTTSRFPRPAGAAAGESTIPDFTDATVLSGLGYATVASFAGLPAITVPAGIDPVRGAPIGVQLFGPPHSEPLLIDAAREVEAAAGDPAASRSGTKGAGQ